ncbi:MAG: OmpA family protein [Candidatus Kapaibacteriota bacterium]
MTSTFRIVFLLFPILVLLSSCTVLRPRSLFKDQICPPPPSQDCYPKRFSGPVLDTASQGKERFMRIRSVEGLNSPVIDEWNVSFLWDSTIWNTASAGGSQILRSIRFFNEKTVSEIYTPEMEENGSLGFVTGYSEKAIAARVSAGAYPGDADIVTSEVSVNTIKPKNSVEVSSLLHWESHPTLSPDGTILIFVSDRIGSIKGTDLYVSIKNGNTWSEPMNCGHIINSKCDELSPFITKAGNILLFASSGHANLGGYDIFTSMFDPETVKKAVQSRDSIALASAFEQPSNIGAPINTIHDELFPSSPSNRIDTLLYYSSNQLFPGEDFSFDIFVYHPAYQFDTVKQSPIVKWQMTSPTLKRADKLDPKTIITIEGKVIDEDSKKPVKNAEVTTTLYPENEIIDQQMTDTAGRYTVKVATNRPVRISAESDELFENALIYTFTMSDSNAVIADALKLPKSIALRVNFPTNEFKDPYPFVLDSNGNETTVPYQQAILKVAQNLQRFQENIGTLAIIGHTDEVGSNDYNMKLGQRRADFIVKQLVKLGVPAQLLKSESKGEEALPKKRVSEDNDTYNKRCRRVELFKLIR